jgi:predicted MFS family arabinose efflux permease
MRTGRVLGALGERPFRLLWLGQTASRLGDGLVPVALAFAVLDLRGSARDLGLVLATYTVSEVVFILAGGVWADRLPRRLLMLGCDIVRAWAQIAIAFLVITDSVTLTHFVLTAAVMGAGSAFFRPASTGLVPQTVSAERLQQANALISLSRSSITVFGPALSGLLVVLIGPGWVFAVNGASYVASAAFLALLRVPRAARAARQTFARELREGFAEVRSRSWVAAALACFAVSNIGIAAYFVLGPLVAERELGGAAAWAIALSGGAIGGVAGGMLALRFQPRFRLRWSFGVGVLFALPLLALIPPAPVLVLAVAGGLSVLSIELSNALWSTTLQERIPERSLSRVSAYDWMVSLVFMPLGYALAGPLAHRIGVDATLAAAAGLTIAANVGVLALPSVRNLPRRDAPVEERRQPAPVAA